MIHYSNILQIEIPNWSKTEIFSWTSGTDTELMWTECKLLVEAARSPPALQKHMTQYLVDFVDNVHHLQKKWL